MLPLRLVPVGLEGTLTLVITELKGLVKGELTSNIATQLGQPGPVGTDVTACS